MNTHIVCPDFELPQEIEDHIHDKLQKLTKLPHDYLDVEMTIRQTSSGTAHGDDIMRVGISARKDSDVYYSDEKAGNVSTAANKAVKEVFQKMQSDSSKRRDRQRKGGRELKDKLVNR